MHFGKIHPNGPGWTSHCMTAQALVAEGARVVVSSRRSDAVEASVELLGNAQVVGVVADNAGAATPSC